MIDSSLTFRALILRVAEAIGVPLYSGADAAAIPSNAHDLDKCKRIVNDALRMFYLAYSSWSFLRPKLEIVLSTDGTGPYNVQSDASRYRLPWFVQGPPREAWTFSLPGSSGYWGEIGSVGIAELRKARAAFTGTTGCPKMIAMTPSSDVPVGIGGRQGWELNVYPDPDQAYSVVANYSVQPRDLTALEERVLAPSLHDAAIQALCVAEGLRQCGPKDELPYWENHSGLLLAASIEFDKHQQRDTFGRCRDTGIYRREADVDPLVPTYQSFTVDGIGMTLP